MPQLGSRLSYLLSYAFWSTAIVASSLPAQNHPVRAQSPERIRPNILWITAEDMSPHLGCYGDADATTPHLDRLATEAVRYQQAYATAPVCSPARSCLITGMYATSLGTQRLRSHFPLPEWCRPFPHDLRQSGYFTTNNVKTDYNVRDEAAMIRQAWDRNSPTAHWRDRPAGQPFFSVFNLMTTHQSRTCVWPFEQFEREVASQLQPDQRHDPRQLTLPPYYPDTRLVRRTWARYHDCITAMDQQVGQLLRELEEDGLASDTIVFFFADHGMGMPRGKRVLHDSGLHVPLLVRFPEKYQGWAPAKPGSTTDRLVSFVDFAPTVLSLVGVPIAESMQGEPFLGRVVGPPRQYVYGARDRVDEVFDLSRSVRDDRYLYIRNYMSHQSWMPPESYSDQAAMRRLLAQMRDTGELNTAQMTYAAPRRTREELYDTWADPHQLRNLANSAADKSTLHRLRVELRQWLLTTRDLGFLPESTAWVRLRADTPWDLARDDARYPLQTILRVADRVANDTLVGEQTDWLAHEDSAVRYWAAVGLAAAGPTAAPARDALFAALQDPDAAVKVQAAAALAAQGETESARRALQDEITGDKPEVVLQAVRTLQLMGPAARRSRAKIEQLLERARRLESESNHPCWMFVRFSAETLLESLSDTGGDTSGSEDK